MILVRSQIRNMFGVETGTITFGKLSINVGLPGERIPSWYYILVHWEGAEFEVVVNFMKVLVTRKDSACCLAKRCDRIALLTLCKQKNPLNLSAHINQTAVYA